MQRVFTFFVVVLVGYTATPVTGVLDLDEPYSQLTSLSGVAVQARQST
jgi:hypothetical protein